MSLSRRNSARLLAIFEEHAIIAGESGKWGSPAS
jgi:hypothetical protein